MSCVTTSTINACEEGTSKISFILQDEEDNVSVPTSISWQLSDNIGNVINSQTFTSNNITGTEQTITVGGVTGLGFVVGLTGDDLSLSGLSDSGQRVFAIQYIYDSSLGTDLSGKGELHFSITNLVNF